MPLTLDQIKALPDRCDRLRAYGPYLAAGAEKLENARACRDRDLVDEAAVSSTVEAAKLAGVSPATVKLAKKVARG